MQASQLTAINNAKNLLEQCGCFRGPAGPTGPQGPTGPAGKTLYYYSDGITIDPTAAGVDPCVYGLFIGSDGSLWRSSPALAVDGSFTATLLNGTVRTIAKQSTGKIIVGGDFTSYNGVTYNNIIRFNSDSSVDTTFSIGTGFNGSVRVITVQSDDKILVGGDFNSYNGSTYQYIIRLNANGSVDSTFNSLAGFDNSVYSIVLGTNNKIYVGGAFSFYNSFNSPSIARLTNAGFIDPTFSIGYGFDGPIYTIVVSSDDSVYVGGDFVTYNAVNFPVRIAHINSDGSYDSNFVTGSGFNNKVYYVKLLSNSNLLIVGAFTNYNGTSVNYVIEIYANGSIYNTFSSGFNSSARIAQVDLSNNYLIGGDFTSYTGNSNHYITRLNNTGSYLTDYPIIYGFNNSVYSIYPETYNTFLVGGSFTSYDSSTSQYLLRLKEKSCSWINTGTNILGNTSNTSTFIYALVSTTNGLGTLGYVSTPQLTSTVRGLGTAGYVSTSQLQSTISGLGNLGYLSTAGSVTLTNLTSTVVGLGTIGYVSSTQLQSTVLGLGTATSVVSTINGLGNLGYISSSQLQSTVRGLGTIGYVSSSQLTSTFLNLSHSGYISSSQLQSTVRGLGTIGYVSTSQLNSTIMGIPKYLSPNFASTIDGLGTSGYISSSQLISSLAAFSTSVNINDVTNYITSTVRGLGTAGYISSTQLLSTVNGLGTLGYISSATLQSSISGLGSTVLPSTVTGLGTFGYISSSQLISSVTGINIIQQPIINSSITGLGTFGYISSSQLISSVTGLGNIYLSSGGASQTAINSTITGLGTFGYISSATLQSTINGLGSTVLPSTITGLGTFGYISSTQIQSTVRGLGSIYLSSFNGSTTFLSSAVANISSLIVNSLTVGTGAGWVDFGAIRAVIVSSIQTNTGLLNASSITGDGSQIFNLPAISSASLQSTVVGLGTFGYISSSQLISSITGIQIIEQPIINSTITGLGTFGYISSATLQSTISGLGSSVLPSTITGLGTFGYISSTQLISTINGLGRFYLSTFTGSTTFLSSAVASISSLNVNSLTIGSGTGFVDFGAVRALLVSSIQTNTGILNASSIIGDGSQIYNLNAISSLSLQSTIIGLGTFGYLSSFNTISSLNISSGNIFARLISTQNINVSSMTLDKLFGGPAIGATTTQNLYPFNAGAQLGFGSNTSQNGFYAEGHFISTFTQVIQPTLDAGQFSNIVYINGNISTPSILVSSITGNTITTSNISSFFYGGIEKYNYISTLALQSTITGLGTFGYISSTQLFSTVTGLGRFYLSTFTGSTIFLSSAVASISSLNVNSLTVNSLTIGSGGGWVDFGAIRAVIVSSIQTNTSLLLTSSINGDGSQIYNLPAISSLSLQSTIVGLGTFGYISSTQLFSTVAGLISTPKTFIIQTFTF